MGWPHIYYLIRDDRWVFRHAPSCTLIGSRKARIAAKNGGFFFFFLKKKCIAFAAAILIWDHQSENSVRDFRHGVVVCVSGLYVCTSPRQLAKLICLALFLDCRLNLPQSCPPPPPVWALSILPEVATTCVLFRESPGWI